LIPCHQRGFTLIEAVIATTLIVLGVVSVISVMSRGMAGDHTVDGQAVALRLAQEEIEKIKNDPNTTNNYLYDTYNTVTGGVALASPFTNYKREVIVTPQATGAAITQVTVNVYWQFKSSSFNMKVALTTLIADTTISSTAP